MSGGDGRLRRVKLAFERNYTQIPNDWLRNPDLSLKARCLLAILLSHDDGYVVTLKSLAATNREGLSAIRSAIDELKRNHFLEIEQLRDRRGRLSGSVWVLTDPAEVAKRRRSQPTISPEFDYPNADNPNAVKPHAVNRTSKEANSEEDLSRVNPGDPSTRAGDKEDALTGDDPRAAVDRRCPMWRREGSHAFKLLSHDDRDLCEFCGCVDRAGRYYDLNGRALAEPAEVGS